MSNEVWIVIVVIVALYVGLGVVDRHTKGRKIDKAIDSVTRLILLLVAIFHK